MTHRLYSMKESTIRPTRVLVQVGYDTKYCQVVGNTYRWLILYSEDRAWKLWQPLSMQADTTQNSRNAPRPPAGTNPAKLRLVVDQKPNQHARIEPRQQYLAHALAVVRP